MRLFLAKRNLWLPKCLLAFSLAAVFAALTVRAISPLVRTWDLSDTAQMGQQAVYNSILGGGKDGMPVELGDYDGDGLLDLVLAPMAAVSAEGTRRSAGEVYVYQGDGKIHDIIDRARPEGLPAALTLWGSDVGDYLGTELFTADLNGDNIDDLIVSSQNYGGPDRARDMCGGVFILLGKPGLFRERRTIDLADANSRAEVITIFGARPGERFGIWVEAGDLDGDGISDLLAGADQSPAEDKLAERYHNGLVTVLYGRRVWPQVIDMATTVPGVSVILGVDKEDHFGSCLHSRDLNGDGRADLIASAALARLSASRDNGKGTYPAHSGGGGAGPGNARRRSGEVYVIFGPVNGGRLPPILDLSKPLPAELEGRVTTIYGPGAEDTMGEEITTGDFNGDGWPDLALGALLGWNASGVQAGMTHVVYWKPGLEGATIDLNPNIPNGLPPGLLVSSLHGLKTLDLLGDTLSAADFNHDGIDDLALGIPREAVAGKLKAGVVAVAFGRSEPWPRVWAPQADMLPPELQVAFILGADAEDLLSYSMEAKDYDTDGYADLYPNAMAGNGGGNLVQDAGEAYLVSGYKLSGLPVSLTGISPTEGPTSKETTVILAGTGFTTGADTRVVVGGDAARDIRVLTATRLEAVFPPRLEPGKVDVRIENRYGSAQSLRGFEYVKADTFIRGDSNLDGRVDIADPVRTLLGLFQERGLPCPDASDADDSGQLNITDSLHLLHFLFLGTPPPPPPFPGPGTDPTEDELGCR